MAAQSIAFLHLAPVLGDLEYNRRLIRAGIQQAASAGAQWVLTPELAVPGYGFEEAIGTGWISNPPDPWIAECSRLAARHDIVLFLSHPERDPFNERLFNSLFVIDRGGRVVGRHRKNRVIAVSEGWATAGEGGSVITLDGIRVGLLICADAYTAELAGKLREAGAEAFVSAAAWCPRPHGPDGCWEERSRETGAPFFVCNRTGPDRVLDFSESESVITQNGERMFTVVASASTLAVVEWDFNEMRLISSRRSPITLTGDIGGASS